MNSWEQQYLGLLSACIIAALLLLWLAIYLANKWWTRRESVEHHTAE